LKSNIGLGQTLAECCVTLTEAMSRDRDFSGSKA